MAPIVDRFRALSPSRQLWFIAAAAALICCLLLAIWLLWLRTSYAPLFTNLSAGDAAVIVAELDRRKISYRLAEGGTAILVPEQHLDAARINVLTGELPLKGAVGFELFNKSDMGLSDFAQRINYQRALQGELARTIMSLDGVEIARVHLSLGEDRIFRDDRVPPKASVTVRMKGRVRLSTRAAQGIQRLIAAAVPKLDAANVVVLDEAGQVVTTSPSPIYVANAPSAIMQKARAIEQYYAARVREALELAHARGVVHVRVSAQLPEGDIGSARGAVSLAGWNPQAREFPLHISLATSAPLDSSIESEMRSVVIGSLGTALSADAVTFSTAPEAAPQAQAEAITVAHAAGSASVLPRPMPLADAEFDWLAQAGLSLLVLLGMLMGFFLVARQLRGTRRLTDQQRADFAAHLRAALATGDDGVKASS